LTGSERRINRLPEDYDPLPHVIMKGRVDLDALAAALEPTVERTPSGIRKIRDVYRNRSGTALLIETTVVEGGATRAFFSRLDRKDAGTVALRIDPYCGVERTPGVSRTLAWVSRRIRALAPELTIETTNLPRDLLEERA